MSDPDPATVGRRTFLRAGPVAVAAALGRRPAEAADLGPMPKLAPKAAVAATLAALEPGRGVRLGRADLVGEFNDTARRYDLPRTGPRGRDYSVKMCWATDRRRAAFCGANHAVPHRLNDVWEFDLPSLTWAMLYAPDLPRGYTDLGRDSSDVEFKGGVLATRRGGPAVVGHTWSGLTYDPKQKALLFMNAWVTDRKKAVRDLGGDPADLYAGPPLWAFSPAAGAWTPLKTPKPHPVPIFGGLLEHVPDLGGSVWHANNWQARGTWLYDAGADRWKDLRANGGGKAFERESPGPEQVGYYDPRRRVVVAHRHHDTFHYDPAGNAWRKVLAGDRGDGRMPYGHDSEAVIAHDPATGHGLLVHFPTNAVWAYDPDRPAWTRLAPAGDPMPAGGKRLAYLDPAANALVVIDGTAVWAYRHKAG